MRKCADGPSGNLEMVTEPFIPNHQSLHFEQYKTPTGLPVILPNDHQS